MTINSFQFAASNFNYFEQESINAKFSNGNFTKLILTEGNNIGQKI
jgi:hypothetical protein